jgi:hypothetical protein
MTFSFVKKAIGIAFLVYVSGATVGALLGVDITNPNNTREKHQLSHHTPDGAHHKSRQHDGHCYS